MKIYEWPMNNRVPLVIVLASSIDEAVVLAKESLRTYYDGKELKYLIEFIEDNLPYISSATVSYTVYVYHD